MAYIADLTECAELAEKNEWVSIGADRGSKECVAAVKALAINKVKLMSTSAWRRGKKVLGNDVLPGTAIATFPIMLGDGERFRYEGHAAIFVSKTDTTLTVYHQWAAKPFHKGVISPNCAGRVSNDAEAYYVIELHEEPSEDDPNACRQPIRR